MIKHFAIAALLLFSSAAVFAQIKGLQDTIAIGEEPYELQFTVENNSTSDKNLTIEIFAPSTVEFTKKPAKISANSSEKISAKIFPKEGLEGSTYFGKVISNLGGEITGRQISIQYFPADACTLNITPGFDGKAFTLRIQNTSTKEKTLEFIEARNLPGDWTVFGKKIEAGSGETRETSLETKTGSGFSGKADLVFNCNGKTTAKSADVNYTNAGALPTGFAILGAIPQINAGIMLDIFLAIVASVLLIAFIARFVKFLNSEAKK